MKKKSSSPLQVRLSGQAANAVANWAELTNISQNKVADLVVIAGFDSLADDKAGQKLKAVLQAACNLEKERKATAARLKAAQLTLRLARQGKPMFPGAVKPAPRKPRGGELKPVRTSQSVLP